ncbi:cardiolipin synthase [Coleophoma crateriformis]|uniref:Cardiolipin synthase n=1 Tax=Coleophoma crateriformis TaxID=565419 RepID=A0A3D8RCL4_9HELO|nr:cardiolipin synthase [Coleophoma crateriformis]
MFSHSFLTLLVQFWLFAVAMAQPITATVHDNAWKYGSGGGVVGFIILILDIIVFIEVLNSNRPVLHKVLWCLVVFLFPIGGMLIYWLFSNRTAHMSGGYEPIA